ncbi:MAG: glycosyltransferase family 4 protein [Methanobacteriota archaeon]
MRVAITAPYELDRVSGVSVFVRALREHLEERGHSVGVITPDRFPSLGRLPRGLRSVALAASTWREVSRGPWDVVHANQPHLQSAAARFAAGRAHARFLVTYHSDLPPADSFLGGLGQRVAHAVLRRRGVVRAFVAASIRDVAGRTGDAIVPVGIEEDPEDLERAEPTRSGRPFTFAFVGRQTASKGFFDLLQVARDLASQGRAFRLVLIGQAEPGETQRKAVMASALGTIVEDLGVVHRPQDVRRILREADALVLPSYHEGLPLVLAEAMSVGCVPLATRVGGIPELIEDGATGTLVPPADLGALRDAMAWMLENPSRVVEMGDRARRHVVEHRSFRQTVDMYLALYRTTERP